MAKKSKEPGLRMFILDQAGEVDEEATKVLQELMKGKGFGIEMSVDVVAESVSAVARHFAMPTGIVSVKTDVAVINPVALAASERSRKSRSGCEIVISPE